ncbi:lasso RiPP family leader peptide-containing protein [Streptomyces chrestomyceticus]|nr:lasso RiPP family leader peptide-containing protein [Streptomyces chrestomyceticus]
MEEQEAPDTVYQPPMLAELGEFSEDTLGIGHFFSDGGGGYILV